MSKCSVVELSKIFQLVQMAQRKTTKGVALPQKNILLLYQQLNPEKEACLRNNHRCDYRQNELTRIRLIQSYVFARVVLSPVWTERDCDHLLLNMSVGLLTFRIRKQKLTKLLSSQRRHSFQCPL